MDKVVGYRSPGRRALAREHVPDAAPPEQMGDDVPQAVRDDAEFQRLFRESQKIKNSRRPADQKHIANLLNQMRVRWGELTGESNAC
jgi:hypothetical protein